MKITEIEVGEIFVPLAKPFKTALRTVENVSDSGTRVQIVVGRLAEMRIIDPNTKMVLMTANIPYGSKLFFNNGDTVKKGE